ncbi:hypothetical protein V3564_06115 [Bartonella sp. B12(2025)]
MNHEKRQFFQNEIVQLDIGLEACIHNSWTVCQVNSVKQFALWWMATLVHVDVLLFDECTSTLDSGMAGFVMRLIEKIVEEKRLTAIMVTHSVCQAFDHGDWILMLHAEKVILDMCQEERKFLNVNDLIGMFQKVCEKALDYDELLMD